MVDKKIPNAGKLQKIHAALFAERDKRKSLWSLYQPASATMTMCCLSLIAARELRE